MRKYYIVHSAVEREVFPLNSFKLKLISELEKDQIFKRTKLNGALQFGNDLKTSQLDYDFFSDLEFNGSSCDEITFIIRKKCFGAWIDEWTGMFSTGGGSFDLDKCLFEVQAEPDDIYRCIFKNWETEFNIFNYDVVDVETNAGTLEECDKVRAGTCFADPGFCTPATYYIPCDGYADDIAMFADGWCVQNQTVEVTGVGGVIIVHTFWCRLVLVVPCSGVCPDPPDGSWTLLTDNCPTDCTYTKCCIGSGVGNDPIRGVRWTDIMDEVIVDLCPDISALTSIFFDKNPDITDPKYVAGVNYITGLTNRVDNLTLSQKSDVIDPTASNPATLGNFNLKLFLDWARELFNCYWKIEEVAGVLVFKLEHYDYYQNTLAVDLTLPQYTDLVKYSNKYDHIKGEIPRREVFSWMDRYILYTDNSTNPNFEGVPIIYPEQCSENENEVSHAAELLTTNVAMLQNNSEAALDGFCLIACQNYSGTLLMLYEVVGVNTYPNGHLAWQNLQENYLRYNRYLGEGNMNGADTTFISWKPNIKQVLVKIPDCCPGIDVEGYVITQLGNTLGTNGIITRAELDLNNDYLTLLISYSI